MYPKFEVVFGRSNWLGCWFVSCNTMRDRVRAIHNAMREGADWIEVWIH